MSRRWPLHPLPYPQESLSSWLERQASSYGYHSDDLLVYDLGFPALPSEALDTDPPALLLERLAERSGLSAERLSAMTIQGWVPRLIDNLKPDVGKYPAYVREYELLYPIELRRDQIIRDWVPWMSAHRLKGRAACRFCLRDGPEPYRRLSWRMAWMTSCPAHGVLLEEIFVVAGQALHEAVEAVGTPVPAPLEILTIDRLTEQAIEEGVVSLPHGSLSGGNWLRLLRTLLDELILPAAPLKQYRLTVVKIWEMLGLGVRQGMRNAAIPFEMLDSARQFVLMRAAGVAVECLMQGTFKRVGKDAYLFTTPPQDHEVRPVPSPDLSPEQSISKELSGYEQAWRKVHVAMQELEVAMRHDGQVALQMRSILLGRNPTPEKIEEIDRLFREQGYILPDDVI